VVAVLVTAAVVVLPPGVRASVSVFAVAGGEADDRAGLVSAATRLTLTQYLYYVGGPAPLSDGSFLLPDDAGNRVLRVSAAGRWAVAAGAGGSWDFGGDGGRATRARFARPLNVAALSDGGFLVSDALNDRVRRVGADGVIRTAAGNGDDTGDAGDGGPAVLAQLPQPADLAALADGGFLVVSSDRVRRVLPDGTIVAFAGTGRPGFSGDRGPATRARIDARSLSVAADGSVLIGGGNRVRRVARDGTISTVAGSGRAETSGDGGPALEAGIAAVWDVHALPEGGMLIADPWAHRIRHVNAAGTIRTVIGPRAFRDFADRESYAAVSTQGPPSAVTTVPDGILLQSTSAVLYVPTSTPIRPAIRITGARVRSRRVRLAVSTTQAGTARVYLRRRNRTIAAEPVRPLSAGSGRLDVTRHSRPNVYDLQAELTTGQGIAADQVTLLLARRLRVRVARNALGQYAEGGEGGYVESLPVGCRRLRARRVDCMIATGHIRALDCDYISAVTLGHDGVLRERGYRCPRRGEPRFRRAPGDRGRGWALPLDTWD
jgi:hypothetical protein